MVALEDKVTSVGFGRPRLGGRLRIAIFMVFFAVLAFCHQTRFDGPTPVSRLDLLHALLEHKTFQIDAFHKNTPDKSLWQGHYYSDKAPGTVLATLPFFVVADRAWRLTHSVEHSRKQRWLASSWISCAGALGTTTALGAVCLFSWLCGNVPPRVALLTTAALLLGGMPLPYCTVMFSHSLTVGLICVAIWALPRSRLPETPHWAELSAAAQRASPGEATSVAGLWVSRNRWLLLAGFSCGWALASEYTAGIVVAGIFCWVVSANPKGAVPFAIAIVPPLLIVPVYSWACFNNLFILPYSLNASFPEMKRGLYAIEWPDAEVGLKLLFSPSRGLLFWGPFLAMAAAGYPRLYTRSKPLFWLSYLVPLIQVVVISGRVWDWEAGPVFGPRYLAPILPLLALPCALGVQRFPKIGFALATYSIAVTTIATLTDACPEFNPHPNPLLDLNMPLVLKGQFSPNLGTVLGLPPYASAALFYAILVGGSGWLWSWLPGERPTQDRPKPAGACHESV